MLRACLFAMVSACWVQPVQQPPVYNQAPPPRSPPPAGATVNKSEWQGTYVCAQGVTALHLAAQAGRRDAVEALLELGADSTLRDALHDGDPAGWAAFAGHDELAARLRQH